jgi:hypothetical protein
MNSQIEKYIKNKGTDLHLLNQKTLTSLPDNFTVNGDLEIASCPNLYRLPENLTIRGNLKIAYSAIQIISKGLEVAGNLSAAWCRIRLLPESYDISIGGDIDFTRSSIAFLPNNLTVNGDLVLQGCLQLQKLPNNLTVKKHLHIGDSTITELTDLPQDLNVRGHIISRHFTNNQAKQYLNRLHKVKDLEAKLPEIEGLF